MSTLQLCTVNSSHAKGEGSTGGAIPGEQIGQLIAAMSAPGGGGGAGNNLYPLIGGIYLDL